MAEQTTPPLNSKDRFYQGLLRLFSRLPLGFLQRFGAMLGLLVFKAAKSTPVFVTRRNLELSFPDKSPEWREQIARTNLAATGTLMFECAKTWGNSPEYSVSMIRKVHNEHLIDEALAAGKGTILIAPHFGNWEFMNAWLSTKAPLTIMYKPGKEPGVDQFVLESRTKMGSTLVPTDERGVKAIFKALKQNGFTAVLPDHVPEKNGGVYAPFFGTPTLTGILTSKLVQKTKCAVVVVYCLRRPAGDGFEIHFEAPHPDLYNDDLQVSATGLNKTVEAVINTAPEQYQWSYKRFKDCEHLRNIYNKSSPPVFLQPHPAQKLFENGPRQ